MPFRDPAFPIYNRGSFTGHEWPLIVDWIYPILTAADKATIRTVFLTWANDCLTASTTGGDFVVVTDPRQLRELSQVGEMFFLRERRGGRLRGGAGSR